MSGISASMRRATTSNAIASTSQLPWTATARAEMVLHHRFTSATSLPYLRSHTDSSQARRTFKGKMRALSIDQTASLSSMAPSNVAPVAEIKPSSDPPNPSQPAKREPRQFKARQAALTLTQNAVVRLQDLLSDPSAPKYLRISVRNKGCAGMAYHLEYVDEAGKFDEVVQQDGVKVVIDSKALFSIIGSEMDWAEDRLSAKFVFNNPNIKDSCGCGESFLV
ncbi:hypothetical protein E5Q_04092 [Mixia osmundae IAM 14324]|uniref:Iron-sulfur assembly protein 1 n=2 Tax=Mixia osmundae (strain CBS 9802 / IAM 14324 / JCM 22182 / KY 12970) TaxID=764103 RepID=G7E3K4_MIXOS|nr:hypothetical protein E5Q_04092 [Mixia osmundae IAM 14324]